MKIKDVDFSDYRHARITAEGRIWTEWE